METCGINEAFKEHKIIRLTPARREIFNFFYKNIFHGRFTYISIIFHYFEPCLQMNTWPCHSSVSVRSMRTYDRPLEHHKRSSENSVV